MILSLHNLSASTVRLETTPRLSEPASCVAFEYDRCAFNLFAKLVFAIELHRSNFLSGRDLSVCSIRSTKSPNNQIMPRNVMQNAMSKLSIIFQQSLPAFPMRKRLMDVEIDFVTVPRRHSRGLKTESWSWATLFWKIHLALLAPGENDPNLWSSNYPWSILTFAYIIANTLQYLAATPKKIIEQPSPTYPRDVWFHWSKRYHRQTLTTACFKCIAVNVAFDLFKVGQLDNCPPVATIKWRRVIFSKENSKKLHKACAWSNLWDISSVWTISFSIHIFDLFACSRLKH